jgi:hypothetical protein
MRKATLVLAVLASTAAAEPLVAVNPADAHWKPKEALPPGAFGATLRGDPTKGDYDFIGKFPAKYTVPMHWHTSECVVVMRRGAMTIGRAGEKDQTIAEGGLFVLSAKLAYTAHCEAECEFLVHGTAPFDIIYSKPEDDPRKKSPKR